MARIILVTWNCKRNGCTAETLTGGLDQVPEGWKTIGDEDFCPHHGNEPQTETIPPVS